MKIWVYISGNLAAYSMLRIADELVKKLNTNSLILLTDELTPNLSKYLNSINPRYISENKPIFNIGDVFITSIQTPGDDEKKLLRLAMEQKATTIVIISDISGSPEKFHDNKGLIVPDYIFVADRLTGNSLNSSGIPDERIYPGGSIYLDEISKNYSGDLIGSSNTPSTHNVALFSVPNEMDFLAWGIKTIPFSEVSVAEQVINTCKSNCLNLSIRKHPKEKGSGKYDHIMKQGIHVSESEEEDLLQFISRHQTIISTYSTALLPSIILKKRTISFQPTNGRFYREKLYKSLNIPTARNIHSLNQQLLVEINYKPLSSIIYNSGCALSITIKKILQIIESTNGYNYPCNQKATGN